MLDSTVFNKKCVLCTKIYRCHGSDQTVKKHKCVKNNEGSSKTMEAAGLVKMLSQILGEKGVSVCTIVSDKDSNARAKAHHIQNGG